MLRTTDEMQRKGPDEMGGRADGRMGGWTGRQADGGGHAGQELDMILLCAKYGEIVNEYLQEMSQEILENIHH